MASSPRPLNPHAVSGRFVSAASLLIVTLIGIGAFALPFLTAVRGDPARVGESLLLTAILSIACLVVLFANLGGTLSAKSVALLGVLVGINAVLRLFDLTFLLPGEFSPIFLLIALVGYVFGAQMGFLMGALTLLVSAFITGGIGPWLPFQMFGAGWMGMTAGWLAGGRRTAPATLRREIIILAMFGFAWGLLYGAILNLYDLPTLVSAELWTTDGAGEFLAQYAAFYVARSLPADLARALGNGALMLALGGPLLRALRRFRSRFEYQVVEIQDEYN